MTAKRARGTCKHNTVPERCERCRLLAEASALLEETGAEGVAFLRSVLEARRLASRSAAPRRRRAGSH